MIMPSRIVKPADSLINISSLLLDTLKGSEKTLDELYEATNKKHYKHVPIEKLFLCLDFLFMINEIESENETNKIKLK